MIYYTFFQNITGIKISVENQIFNYSKNAHEDILKILKTYYEINMNRLPKNLISALKELIDEDVVLIEDENTFNFFAPILEHFIYTDEEIKNNQIVGLALICNELHYIKLVNSLSYSFQVAVNPSDVDAFYFFKPYKDQLAPSTIHFADSIFSYSIYTKKENDKNWIDGEGID